MCETLFVHKDTSRSLLLTSSLLPVVEIFLNACALIRALTTRRTDDQLDPAANRAVPTVIFESNRKTHAAHRSAATRQAFSISDFASNRHFLQLHRE